MLEQHTGILLLCRQRKILATAHRAFWASRSIVAHFFTIETPHPLNIGVQWAGGFGSLVCRPSSLGLPGVVAGSTVAEVRFLGGWAVLGQVSMLARKGARSGRGWRLWLLGSSARALAGNFLRTDLASSQSLGCRSRTVTLTSWGRTFKNCCLTKRSSSSWWLNVSLVHRKARSRRRVISSFGDSSSFGFRVLKRCL